MLDDGEPQARAARFARAAAVHAVKALGEPRYVLGFDAHTRVLHPELGTCLRAATDAADLAPGRRVAHGVAREVAECAGDLRFGPEQVEARLGVERDALAARPERLRFAVGVR